LYTKNFDGTANILVRSTKNTAISTAYLGGYRSTTQTESIADILIDTETTTAVASSPGFVTSISVIGYLSATSELTFVFTAVASQTATDRTAQFNITGRWYV
jgi:hypothetical protein